MRKLSDMFPGRAIDTPSPSVEPRNFETEVAAELNEMQQGFKDRAQAEAARFKAVTDSEYWVCLCFQTRAQAEEFAAKLGLPQGQKYADGRSAAERLGIQIDSPDPVWPKMRSLGKIPVGTLRP